MVLVTTPPNVTGILVSPEEDYTRRKFIILCESIDVRFQIQERYVSDAFYYEHCRSCEYRIHDKCIGGKQVVLNRSCAIGLDRETRTMYVPKTIPPHVVRVSPYGEYSLFFVEEATDTDFVLAPLLLGNVTTYGSLCGGDMRVSRYNFVAYYEAIWSLVWTGDYRYFRGASQKTITENWSPEWQRENYDSPHSYNNLFVKSSELLDVNSLESCIFLSPGSYDILNADTLSARQTSTLLDDGYIGLNSRTLVKSNGT